MLKPETPVKPPFAINGFTKNGIEFIPSAIENGAKAIIVEPDVNIESLNLTLRYIFDVSEYIKDSSFKDNVYSLMINKGIPFDFKITIV